MPEIRVLPEQVANQIAAGEVVERPASAVKELLENALDAGATRITVDFRHGGKSFISIEDNGCGMTPDQALLALEMHATSKIRRAEDLNEIHTFGFRGEAVPSIASISRFLLKSRPADAISGTEILINAGKIIHQKEVGMAPGTRIEVANLFHPVPARLKFLKTEATEAAHITRLARLYTIAQSSVSFTLREDGEELFHSPASQDLRERVREIWGSQLADDLLPMAPVEARGMRLWGLLGKPGVGRMTRQEMVTIVNGRPVDCRTLAYALVESYHTLLPKGRFPLAFLFLDIEPSAVDVNVHPAKREIRFREESRVRFFVINAVLKHLEAAGGGITFDISPVPFEKGFANQNSGFSRRETSNDTGGNFANDTVPAPKNSGNFQAENPKPQISSEPKITKPETAGTPSFRLNWRFLARLKEGYALFETDAGFVVLDPRAAQERIWFERILARFENHDAASQRLLLPVPLDLEPLAASTLRERQPVLSDAGFGIEEFGRNFFRVTAVPDWLAENDTEVFLRDIIAKMGRSPGDFNRLQLARETLARLAGAQVRNRVVADVLLTGAIRELFLCKHPTTDPQGKPVFFEITHAEVARRLG